MSNQKFVIISAAAMFLTTACSDEQSKEEQVPQETTYPVEIAVSSNSNKFASISSVGTIRFRRETALGFTTSGKVSNVRFNEGDRVKRGALIASLDTTTVDADINVARAELDRSKSEYDRIATLFEQGWVTKARLEQSQAAFQAAEARIKQAQFSSDTSRLYAPSNGIIITRNIDPGQILSAGSPAIIFGQADVGYVLRVPLSSVDTTKISIGMPVAVTITSIPDAQFPAVVTEIDGRADENTGSFFAIVELPNDSRLKSGQIGTANFTIESDNKNITVPASAISGIRGSEGIVYVYDDKEKRVSIRNVILGGLDDKVINILDGLSLGEKVVLRGHEKLVDGSKVEIVRRGKTETIEKSTESEVVAE